MNPIVYEAEVQASLQPLNKSNAADFVGLVKGIFPEGRFAYHSRTALLTYADVGQLYGRFIGLEQAMIQRSTVIFPGYEQLQPLLDNNLFLKYQTIDAEGHVVRDSTFILDLTGVTRFAAVKRTDKTVGLYVTDNNTHRLLLVPK